MKYNNDINQLNVYIYINQNKIRDYDKKVKEYEV